MAKKTARRRRKPNGLVVNRRKAAPIQTKHDPAAVEACARAIKQAGGDAQMAAPLGLSRMAVWKWRVIPTERVPAVSATTGIPRHELRPDRPDLFPPPIVLPQTA